MIFIAKFLLIKAANGGGVLVKWKCWSWTQTESKLEVKNHCLYILLDDCDLDNTISNVYLLFVLRFLVEHEVQVQVAGCLCRGRMKVKTLPRLICNSAALGREIII